jgi:hypothetical protein
VEDSTTRVLDTIDLVDVLRDAIEASGGQFTEENAVGSYRNCMTLFLRSAHGLELIVSVTGPEQLG